MNQIHQQPTTGRPHYKLNRLTKLRDAKDMDSLQKSGMGYKQIADKYGLTKGQVATILNSFRKLL